MIIQRVIITGSRHINDVASVEAILEQEIVVSGLWCDVIVHGGASGVDRIADAWARRMRYRVEVFEAEWSKHGRSAGPIRNARMVAAGACLMIGIVQGPSHGARGAMEMARQAGITVYCHELGYDGEDER